MFNLTLTTSSSLSFLELDVLLALLLISIRLLNAFLEELPPFLAGGSTSIFAWRRALLAARADTRRAEDPSETDGDGGLVSSCEKVTLVFLLGFSPSLALDSSELFRIYVYNEERCEWVKYWHKQSGKAFFGFSIPGHQKMMGSAVQLRNWIFGLKKIGTSAVHTPYSYSV